MMHTYKESFFDECYFEGFPTRNWGSGTPVVVDIGANVGYFSLFMLHINPQAELHAYEPIPTNFALLQSYQEENKDLAFSIYNEAVAAEKGVLELTFDKADSFSTSASIFEDKANQDAISVPAITLNEVFDRLSGSEIDFLKVDCEGSEYGILFNCPIEKLARIKHIALETHPGKAANENRDALAAYLQDNGFQTIVKRSKIWAWH